VKTSIPRDSSTSDRLAILQRRDIYRDWRALSEKRFCIFCERKISGQKILIKRDDQGIFHLHCPTPGCEGTPREWVFPGNPLTSESVYEDWWRALNRENDEPARAPFGANIKPDHA
jgi:hypothetical protein